MDKRIEVIRKDFPYTAQYAEKYGFNSLISTFEVPSKYGTPERLYKECIEKGLKVEKLINKPPKNTIL